MNRTLHFIRSGLLLLALFLCPLRAQEPANSPRELLRDALYAEEVTRDAGKAAEHYAKVIELYKAQQPFAATAYFRLAEVRRKQGNKEEAIRLYQQLLRDFPAAEVEGKLARENLAALGSGEVPEPAAVVVDEEAQELRRIQDMVKNAPDRAKNSFLAEHAVDKDQARVLQYLLDSGLETNPARLLPMSDTGHVKIVQMLIARTPKDAPEAREALVGAIDSGYKQVAGVLLDSGVKPNFLTEEPSPTTDGDQKRYPADSGKVTPLHLALRRGDMDLVRLLLDHGADPNAMAERPGDLHRGYPTGSPLHQAVSQGPEAFKLLLSKGGDPKLAAPGTGLTPLHVAASANRPEILENLLQAGAELEARTKVQEPEPRKTPFPCNGETPLLCAVKNNAQAAVRFLLEKGADPNAKTADGTPALGHAVKEAGGTWGKREDLVRLLIEHKADPKVRYGSLAIGRHAGYKDPFFTGTESETITDFSLLWPASTTTEGDGPVPTVALLLEAGVTAGPELSEVIWRIGTRDRDGKLVRALAAQHRGPVNFEELPDMQGWGDAAKTAYLESVIYPLLATRSSASLMRLFDSIKPIELAPPVGAAPASTSLARLLLSNPNYLSVGPGSSGRLALALVRKAAPGAEGAWSRSVLDPNADAPFPELQPGDIVELSYILDEKTPNRGAASAKVLNWDLRKKVQFPVTLEIDGSGPRDLTLRGDLLVHDLRRPNEVPWIGCARLVRAFTGYDGDPEITVQREGWQDIQVKPYAGSNEADFELEAGDKVVVRWKPHPDRIIGERKKRIQILGEGLAWRGGYKDENEDGTPRNGASLPTLAQALVDLDDPGVAAPGMASMPYPNIENEILPEWLKRISRFPVTVFPFPDYSRIRIRRLQDDGSEKVIPVDFTPLVAAAGAGTLTVEQARAADLPLLAGDIVEIPTRQDKLDEAWKGWSEAEAAFFAKALDCRVQVTDPGGLVSLRELRYRAPRYLNWGKSWVPAAPVAGSSSVTAAPAFFPDFNPGEIELTRGGQTSPKVDAHLIFVREGDAMKLIRPQVNAPNSTVQPQVPPPRPRLRNSR